MKQPPKKKDTKVRSKLVVKEDEASRAKARRELEAEDPDTETAKAAIKEGRDEIAQGAN